ncbi:MAG TPA: carboxypeptidase regulatory-like domain-containing protein [Longimicrobium sp.]|nr:carboxypeptidase regulatory-like domain-containing protein [Longimicrobium sp.]
MRRFFVRALLLAAGLATPAALAAQDSVVVKGTVRAADGGVPQAGVRVWSHALGVGVDTDGDGRYRLVAPADRAAPGETIDLRAGRPGLAPRVRRVVLPPDSLTGADFALEATPLDAASRRTLLVTGTVRAGAGGTPIPGALVRIEAIAVGATTRADGSYRLRMPMARAVAGDTVEIHASRVGFRGETRTVVLAADSVAGVDFALEGDVLRLDAVVGSELPATRRRSVTGAGAADAVAGKAPGVTVTGAPAPTGPPVPGEAWGHAEAPAPADGPGGGAPEAGAGVLTAGLLDDFGGRGWGAYRRFLERHRADQEWGLEPWDVLRVRVTSGGRPLRDHPVVVEQGERRYEMRTLADGTLRIFTRLEHRLDDGAFTVTPEGGTPHRLVLSPGLLRRGRASVDQPVAARGGPAVLDLALMVDATGSMSDEMEYLKTELRDIVARVQPLGAPLEVRISIVYYRDRGDEFVTRAHPFGTDVDAAVAFLAATTAGGGGDTPEEMNEALRVSMAQAWSEGPAARILFVVADAPPHAYPDARYTYHDAVADAARRGIAVFPVAASGIDRPTEYLLRALAVTTGGKYLFLTDHSGVGNPHLTPEEDFEVHRLNDLMVREIRAFVAARFPELRGFASR